VDDLTREFLLESQEGLDRMDRCLTDLETRPGDRELLAAIFRTVHTIKGTTGFLGFGRLEALSHAGENLLALLRDGKLEVTPEIVSAQLALMDLLRGILHSIETTGAEGVAQSDDRAMICRLEALHQAAATVAVGAAASAGTAGRSGMTASCGPAAATELPIADVSLAPYVQETAAAPAMPEPDRVRDTSAATTTDRSPGAQEKDAAPAQEAQAVIAGGATESTLRVNIDLLNRMMNLVGELVLTRNQILATQMDAGDSLLGRRLDMVTTDLREAVMKARMQPVSHVFSRFPRLVRDLSLGLSKRVRLEMEGQETELDKGLLEAIRDPLTHSIRNSIDHGIEMPAAREAAGKPAEGVVRLRAFHEGSHVIVEVCDDGAGMNIEKIRAKAIERGLLTAARADQMNQREILQLIFLPGFSTAAAVTNVSGRGVGMDVVRTNVERIGGKVEIESEAGRGTVMRLRIPLTLAIVPALIVRSRGQNFALPQAALTELVHLGAGDQERKIEWMENAALYRLRGRLLPLVFLNKLLKQSVRENESACDIAILNADGHRFGLVVDGLADPEEIVVKPLAGVLQEIGYYAGATILGNGEMALILNPSAIAKEMGIGVSSDLTEESAGAAEATGKEYLLVETNRRRAALPLELVERIERIPRSSIERAGDRPVLRFGATLLPLDDAAADALRDEDGDEAQTTVVVCRDGERHVGVTVSQVLDVAAGQRLQEAGTGADAEDITLLQDRVTEIYHLSSVSGLDSNRPDDAHRPEVGPDPEARTSKEQSQEVCSIRVGETTFVVPIAHLLEILNAPGSQSVPLAPYFVGGLVHYRGEVLTAVSLRRLLEMEPCNTPEHVLVFESEDGPFGLFVDAVGEVFRVNDSDHEPNPPTLEARGQALFAGEWKLKDRLLVSLDPDRLVPVHLARAFPA
jgi:two-component system chemotaxis sensor kinase CheA